MKNEPLLPGSHARNEKSLEETAKAILDLHQKAENPVVLVDMDVDRFEVAEEMIEFVEKTQTPFAQMTTGKAVLDENHPPYRNL